VGRKLLWLLLRGVIVVPLDVQSDPAFVARVQETVGAKLYSVML